MTLLGANGISVILGGREVLHGVDIELAEGEIVGLIGPNGAGKTTLLRVLANLQSPVQGGVRYGDRPLAELDARQVARRVAYLAQNVPIHWPLTVRSLTALGRLPRLGPWQRPGEVDRLAIDRAMALADVDHLADRPVTTLSGGERVRALIARALAVEPAILLADEPVAMLDPYHQLHVMELLRGLARRGDGAIVVLHDLTLAARFCDRLVLLHDGRIAAEGEPATVLSDDNIAKVYRVSVRIGADGKAPYVLPWRRLNGDGPPGRAL